MNINAALQSYGMEMSKPLPEATGNTGGKPDKASAKTHAGETDNTVHLSAQGKTLSGLPPRLLPTRENVQKLSEALSDSLNELLSEAGISPEPAVEFDVNSYTGKVSINDNRPDAQRIAKLLKENPDIKLQIHNIAVINSHAAAFGQAMEVRSPQNAVAKYASIHNSQNEAANFLLTFNGKNVQINASGAARLLANAH